ncbi:MAG: molybdenum cofactor biosynthesis protein MoaE [Oscillatoriales cyanobacterium SM2_2_1]|nr:molybdenum cofactor biosynthesis protein MoaE [Oscillatoriales cyanobacterium SM2_2_1]
MTRDEFAWDLRLGDRPLDVGEVYQLAETPANGAVVLMGGMVRQETHGRQVQYLDYQAYEPMAERQLRHLVELSRKQVPEIRRVVIHHRLGRLAIAELSVLVAVGSPHRAAAFEACRFLIDRLKTDVAIWKKEIGADGTSRWVAEGVGPQILQPAP